MYRVQKILIASALLGLMQPTLKAGAIAPSPEQRLKINSLETNDYRNSSEKMRQNQNDFNKSPEIQGRTSSILGDAKISIAFSPSEGYEKSIWGLFSSAKDSIKICMYILDDPIIVKLIRAAQQRGVKIEVILFEPRLNGNANRQAIAQELKDITELTIFKTKLTDVIGSQDKELIETQMHHKFIIIDNNKVWTGSGNLSTTAINGNDEAGLLIEHPAVTEIYSKEFGRLKKINPKELSQESLVHKANVGDGQEIIVLFLPSKQNPVAYIRNLLGAAKENITLLMPEITDWKIAQALILCHERGIQVSILTNPENEVNSSSQIKRLQEAGIQVVFSKNDTRMHQRCMVIDSKKVLVGSNNFSMRGLKDSAENMVLFEDETIAKAIEEEFVRCSKAISYRESKWSQ